MNLNKIFAIMSQKGFHYLSGHSNSTGYWRYIFSTGHDGRGDTIEIISFPTGNNTFKSWIGEDHIEEENITAEKVYELLA